MDTQEFEPVMVYKDGGPHQRRGGTFDIGVANSQEELDSMLTNSWYAHPDRIGTPQKQAEVKAPESNDPPTRDELELKAKELGIKFTAKTSDEELGKLIAAKLG